MRVVDGRSSRCGLNARFQFVTRLFFGVLQLIKLPDESHLV